MRAVRLYDDGLRSEQLPRPTPGPGDVLVSVRAAAITRDELTWPTDRLSAIPSHELSGVTEPVAREALRRAMHKLPMKCRFVKREVGEA